MNKLLSEICKVDIALTSLSLNGAGTGQYFNMKKCRKALFMWEVGAMAAGVTSIGQVMEAQDAAATGAQVLTGLTGTITANTLVAEMTLTLVTVLVGDTVTINGLTYTAAAAADLPNRVFDQSGDDTADAASLVLAINHATAGVPGVTATSALGVVTLVATEPGEAAITATSVGGTITIATLRAVGYVEVDHTMMTKATAAAAAFTHLALRVTNSAAVLTGAVLVRDNARYTPVQYVAAADVSP